MPIRHDRRAADPGLHPDASTFDGLALAEERRKLTLDGFVERFLEASGHRLDELSSRLRGNHLIDGRVEKVTLALSRHGLRARDFSTLLCKHGATITRWLNKGLRRERDDPAFEKRLDELDRTISSDRHNARIRNVVP